MRVILSLLLLVCSYIPVNAASAKPPVLLILGDSLSAGFGMDIKDSWVSLLETRLHENQHDYQILNSSITGDTTEGGLARLPRLLAKYQPTIVIIELGGNDGLRGISPETSRNNMASMVHQSKQAGAQVLLAGIKLPPNYGSQFIQQFESIYTDLATEYDILLVPFFMDGVVFEPKYMQADGIHPNEEGQPVLLDNIWEILAPKLKP